MIVDCSDIQLNKLTPKNDFEKKIFIFFSEWQSKNPFMSIKSSGSTGEPKIFNIEKSKMINSATMTCDFLRLEKNNIALLCLPVEYISGKMLLVRSIIREMTVIIREPSLKPLDDISQTIDFCAMTPLQVENSLNKLHLIKKLIIGGAAVSESLKSKLSTFDTEIYETYGMSETLSHIALKKIRPTADAYFTCFSGIEISKDDRGCLKIVAPSLNPEILQTNDLVEIINDKQFRFLGRIDNIINSGGAKISPEELETIVKKQIPNEVVFMGQEDEQLGQKLVLIVEGEKTEEIMKTLAEINYLQKYHRPKEIIFINKIPRTENAKISRPKLKELLKNQTHD